jgi:hypothetical protein
MADLQTPRHPGAGRGPVPVHGWIPACAGMTASLFMLCSSLPALADDDWRSSWDVALHATAGAVHLQSDSVLNPANTLARLGESTTGAEARINIKLESDLRGVPVKLSLRPILSHQRSDDGTSTSTENDAYLSQWQLRAALADPVSLSLGREVMNWGPAQFRSPSSPFYFDNGRANPSRELTGVDSIKLAWTPDVSTNVSLAWVKEGDDAAGAWNQAWLMKGERRGDDWTGGLILARAAGRKPFLGAYAQWTPDEAWLLYGEASSATRADALGSPADPLLPFSLHQESARKTIALLGAARTLENGHNLSLEYLLNGHGYRDAEAAAYFNRAAANPAAAALALIYSPPLLARHYLHLVWQSNPLEDGGYWRVMWSRNLNDASNEWAGFYEHPLDRRLSLYALGALNDGDARREFGALIENRLLIGIRLALP